MTKKLEPEDYKVGWICALGIESSASKLMLNETHESLPAIKNDTNIYTLGSIEGLSGMHNVVMTHLPQGSYGTARAAVAITSMKLRFTSLSYCLLVGIGGGIPSEAADIRLGDVVVSCPIAGVGGVVPYDLGKTLPGETSKCTGTLNKPSEFLLNGVSAFQGCEKIKLQSILEATQARPDGGSYKCPGSSRDRLFRSNYTHVPNQETCGICDSQQIIDREPRVEEGPKIHYGSVASGNQVMKDGITRDKLRKMYEGILCFEMEAAGIMDSLPCLVIRGISDYADSHKNDAWHQYAALVAAAYAKALLKIIPHEEAKASRREKEKTESYEQEVLAAVRFRDMDTSYETIEEHYDNTCEWIYKHHDFRDWMHFGSGFYWIAGKPGSGKSTVMKFLRDNAKTMDILKKSQPGPDVGGLIIGSFFFQERASNPLLRSRQGILRVILYQILEANRALIKIALPNLYEEAKRSVQAKRSLPPQEWAERSLREAFDQILNQNRIPLRLFLVIDGLDEFHEPNVTERQLFSMLGRIFASNHPQVRVQLCVSSRPEPVFEALLGNYRQLRIQEFTRNDMKKFVKGEMKNLTFLDRLRDGTMNRATIERCIVEDSQGVFLWTKLVIRSLQEGVDCCETWNMIHDRLKQIPTELEALYTHLLSEIKESHRTTAAIIFQLVLTTTKHLSPVFLSFILDRALACETTTNISKTQPDSLRDVDEIMRRRSQAFCRGLVEWKEEKVYSENVYYERLKGRTGTGKNLPAFEKRLYFEKAPQYLVFLHLTVRSYLKDNVDTWFSENLPQDFSNNLPLYMAQACIQQLKSIPAHLQHRHHSLQYGSLEYALQKGPISMLFDLYDNDPDKISPCLDDLDKILQNQYRPSSPSSHWTDLANSDEFMFQHNNFISYMASVGKYEYVKREIRIRGYNPSEKEGKPFLLYILQISDIEPCMDSSFVQTMLQSGCDPNESIESDDIIGYSCQYSVPMALNITVWEVFLCEVCYFHFFQPKLSRTNWLEILEVIKVLLEGDANPDVIIPIEQLDVKNRHRKYKFEMSVLSVVCQIASGPSWLQNLNDPVLDKLVGVKDEVKESLKRKGQEELYILSSKTRGDLEVNGEEFLNWRTCLLRLRTTTSDSERAKLLEDELRLHADGRWRSRIDEGEMSDTDMSDTDISDVVEEIDVAGVNNAFEKMHMADEREVVVGSYIAAIIHALEKFHITGKSDADEEMCEDDLEVSGVDRKRKRFSDEDQETTEGASRLPRHFRT